MAIIQKIILTVGLLGLGNGIATAGFNTNLIVNGDAESGPGATNDSSVVAVPGWATIGNFTTVQYGTTSPSGDFPSDSSPGPADRGLNFFAGGPSNASSSASQVINESADASIIDTGLVKFNLSGYFGGFASQGDYAVLTATFLGASNQVLGTTSIGDVTVADRGDVTGLLSRSTSSFVAIGTRDIQITLTMTRLNGSYNDGYADNLSLVLVSPVPEPSSLFLCSIAGAIGLATAHARSKPRLERLASTPPVPTPARRKS